MPRTGLARRLLGEPGPLYGVSFAVARSLPTPLALEREAGPVVGSPPALLPPDFVLGLPQRRGRREAFRQHPVVEAPHELISRPVVDVPHAQQHAFGAGVEESTGHPHHALAANLL